MTLAVVEKTLPMATITGRTDRQTDGQTQYAAPSEPPREEGRIINVGVCVCIGDHAIAMT